MSLGTRLLPAQVSSCPTEQNQFNAHYSKKLLWTFCLGLWGYKYEDVFLSLYNLMWYVVNRSHSTAKARKSLLGECDAFFSGGTQQDFIEQWVRFHTQWCGPKLPYLAYFSLLSHFYFLAAKCNWFLFNLQGFCLYIFCSRQPCSPLAHQGKVPLMCALSI